MKYFQFRVSEHSCLDRELQKISKEIWLKMKDFLRSKNTLQDKGIQFEYALKYILHEHVLKYPNCGLTAECHDDIEGGPWMDYNDKIYMISSVGSLEELINQISNEVLEDLADTFEMDKRSELQSVLSTTLRHELGKYIYFNPSCKRIPFCELEL